MGYRYPHVSGDIRHLSYRSGSILCIGTDGGECGDDPILYLCLTSKDGIVHFLLNNRVSVYIGMLSYSIYLWRSVPELVRDRIASILSSQRCAYRRCGHGVILLDRETLSGAQGQGKVWCKKPGMVPKPAALAARG